MVRQGPWRMSASRSRSDDGGPNRCRRRIVQLVREPGREASRGRGGALAVGEPAACSACRRTVLRGDAAPSGTTPASAGRTASAPSTKNLDRTFARKRVVVHLPDPITEVRLKCAGVDATLVGSVDLDVVGAHPTEQGDRALQEDVEGRPRVRPPEGPSPARPPRRDRLDTVGPAALRSASRTGTGSGSRRRHRGGR